MKKISLFAVIIISALSLFSQSNCPYTNNYTAQYQITIENIVSGSGQYVFWIEDNNGNHISPLLTVGGLQTNRTVLTYNLTANDYNETEFYRFMIDKSTIPLIGPNSNTNICFNDPSDLGKSATYNLGTTKINFHFDYVFKMVGVFDISLKKAPSCNDNIAVITPKTFHIREFQYPNYTFNWYLIDNVSKSIQDNGSYTNTCPHDWSITVPNTGKQFTVQYEFVLFNNYSSVIKSYNTISVGPIYPLPADLSINNCVRGGNVNILSTQVGTIGVATSKDPYGNWDYRNSYPVNIGNNSIPVTLSTNPTTQVSFKWWTYSSSCAKYYISTFYKELMFDYLGTKIINACAGQSNGKITIKVNDNFATKIYALTGSANQTINTSSDTYMFQNLPKGNYTVTVTNISNPSCPISNNSYVIGELPQLTINEQISNPCNGQNQGKIIATVNDNSFQKVFTLSIGSTIKEIITSSSKTVSFNILSPNTYTLKVDYVDNSCPVSKNISLNTVNLSLDYSKINILSALNSMPCGAIYNISYSINNGSGSYSYAYNKDGGPLINLLNSYISNLQPGQYNFRITDNIYGCESQNPITIFDGSLSINSVDQICNTTNAVVTASGGYSGGTLSYNIDNGTYQSNNTFPAISPGSRNFKIKTTKDSYSCELSTPYSKTIYGILDLNITPTINCSSVSLSLQGTGWSGNYSYQVKAPGQTVFSNTTSPYEATMNGIYEFKVISGNCSFNKSFSVSINPISVFATPTSNNENCSDAFAASILATITNGNSPFKYDLLNSSGSIISTANNQNLTTYNFNNLQPGNYSVKVTDSKDCSATSSIITITGNPRILNISNVIISKTDYYCNLKKGSITISGVTGDTPINYTISLIGSSFTQTNNTGVFNNLDNGNYTIYIQSGNCIKNIRTITNPFNLPISPLALSISLTPTHADDCYDLNKGKIQLNITGGSGSYKIEYKSGLGSWTIWNGGTLISGLKAGTYNVRVTDNIYTCSSEASTYIQGPINLLTITATGFNSTQSCYENSNGSIVANITQIPGGDRPPSYTYSILNGYTIPASTSLSGTFNNLTKSTYSVQVQDQWGCLKSQTVTIDGPVGVFNPGSYTATQPYISNCTQVIKGTIRLTGASGGTEPYQYSINGGVTWSLNAIFTDLNSGIYILKIKDFKGCQKDPSQNSVSIQQVPTLLSISNVQNTAVTGCYFNTNGSIIITASGGVGTLYYSINNGATYQTSGIFSNISKGTYPILVIDQTGCQKTWPPVVITGPSPLSGSFSVSPVTDCYTNLNGKIVISAQNGRVPIQYSKDGLNFQTNNIFSNLGTGTYPVYIKDDCNEVKYLGTAVIVGPVELKITNVTKSNVKCHGGSDGIISVIASGGTGTLQYSFDNGMTYQTGSVKSGLPAEFYYIKVKDANGCVNDATCLIEQPKYPLNAIISSWDVTCKGANDGVLWFNASGGSNNFEYSIYNDSWKLPKLFENLTPGTYHCKLRDRMAPQCEFDAGFVTIKEPAEVLSINSIAKNDANCYGAANGSITIEASGGNGGYLYSFDGGITYQSNKTKSDCKSGDYIIYVKDYKNCFKYGGIITINQPNQLTLNSNKIDNVTCNGWANGKLTLYAAGGSGSNYKFSDDNGVTYSPSNIFTGLKAQSYLIKIADGNVPGCYSDPIPITVSEPEQIDIRQINKADISCAGLQDGMIEVIATGRPSTMEYSFNNGLTFSYFNKINTLPQGNFTIQVRDPLEPFCITLGSSISITMPDPISANVNSSNATCYNKPNGKIEVHASGGYGSYEYTFDGKSSYILNNFKDNLIAGKYFISVRDKLHPACNFDIGDVLITEPEDIDIFKPVHQDSISCKDGGNGKIEIYPIQNHNLYEYSFDNGATYQTDKYKESLTAANYGIIVRSKIDSQCKLNAGIVNILNPEKISSNLEIAQITCPGKANGSVKVIPSGGRGWYKFKIGSAEFTENSFFPGLHSGSYRFKVCDYRDTTCFEEAGSTTIIEPIPLVIDSVIPKYVTCNGGSNGVLTVYVKGGGGKYEYSIDNIDYQSSNIFDSLPKGDYVIYVRMATDHSCGIVSEIITISEPEKIEILNISTIDLQCYNTPTGEIIINATGGNQLIYSINNGSTFQNSNHFKNLPAGNYLLKVQESNDNQCFVNSQIELTQPAELKFTQVKISNVTCFGGDNGSVSVIPTGGYGQYQYSFDNGVSYSSDPYVLNLKSAIINLYLRDKLVKSCISKPYIVNIRQPGKLLIDSLSKIDITCFGANNGFIMIHPSGGSGKYEFKFDNTVGFASDSILNNCKPGVYNLSIRDINDRTCISEEYISAIKEPYSLEFISVERRDITCNGQNTGQINILVKGGSGKYEYSVDGGLSFVPTSLFSGLYAGDYQIIVRDFYDHQCFKAYPSLEIMQPVPIEVKNVDIDSVSCFGGNNGTIAIETQVDMKNYEFSFDNGSQFQTSNMKENIPAGIYGIRIREKNDLQCVKTFGNYEVFENEKINYSTVIQNVSCNNGSNGDIIINATGGSHSYLYSIDNGQNFFSSNKFAGLKAGNLGILVKDKNDLNCITDTEKLILSEPQKLSVSQIDITNATCFNKANGNITITANGGSGIYRYSIDGGQNFAANAYFENLLSGQYQVQVQDNADSECLTAIFLNEITQPQQLKIDSVLKYDIGCIGSNSGEIDIYGRGGLSLRYSINNGITSQDQPLFSNLPPGNYQVRIFENIDNECFVSKDEIILNEQPGLIVKSLKVNHIKCKGAEDGFIELNVLGGSGQFEYSFDGGISFYPENFAKNLKPGVYQIIARDTSSHECKKELTVEITEPSEALNLDENNPVIKSEYNELNVSSCNASDGWFSVYSKGGTGLHRYSLTFLGTTIENGNSNTFRNLQAGFYKVTVADENSCKLEIPVVLENNFNLKYVITNKINSTCGNNDGSATVTISGGSEPYLYQWDDDSKQQNPNANQLKSGMYHVSVYDIDGCFIDIPIGISDFEGPEVDILSISPSNCYNSNDGKALLQVNSSLPYQVKWSDTPLRKGLNAENLTKGPYLAEIKNSLECKTIKDIEIQSPDPLILQDLQIDSVSCFKGSDGQINIVGNGGTSPYSFELKNALLYNPIANGLSTIFNNDISAGKYHLKIRDSKGCERIDSFEVFQPDIIDLEYINIKRPLCSGGNDANVEIKAIGGVSPDSVYNYHFGPYAVKNKIAEFKNLLPGDYTLIVSDNKNCSITRNINVTAPPALSLKGIEYSNPKCFGQSSSNIKIEATGGSTSNGSYTYKLESNSQMIAEVIGPYAEFQGQKFGIYTVTIIDENNCYVTHTFGITEPDKLTVLQMVANQPKCFGGQDANILISMHGGTSISGNYQYSIKSTTFSNSILAPVADFTRIAAGEYTIEISDSNACYLSEKILINEPSQLQIERVDLTHPNCFGENNGVINISAIGGSSISGDYTYTLIDGLKNRLPIVSANAEFTSLSDGFYSVETTDDHLCLETTRVRLIQPENLEIENFSSANPNCFGESNAWCEIWYKGGTSENGNYDYQLFGTNGLVDERSGTQVKFDSLTAGNYSIQTSDDHGCKANYNVVFTDPAKLQISEFQTTDPLCYGTNMGELQVSSSGGTILTGYSYELKLNNSSQYKLGINLHFTNLAPGKYKLKVSDDHSCSSEQAFLISEPPELKMLSFSYTNPLCFNQNSGIIHFSVTGGSPLNNNYQYILNSGANISNYISDDSISINGLYAGKYLLTAEDNNQCRISNEFLLIDPLELIFKEIIVTEPLCYGDQNGLISAEAQGGTSSGNDYYFRLFNTNGQIESKMGKTVDFDSLKAGIYNITVTDNHSCFIDKQIAINQPSKLIIDSLRFDLPLCYGGKNKFIKAYVSGGSSQMGKFKFGLFRDGILNMNLIDTIGYFPNQPKGSYQIKTTDFHNCTANENLTITEPPQIIVSSLLTKNPLCAYDNTGSMMVTASGGVSSEKNYQYDLIKNNIIINNNYGLSASFSGLSSGIYNIKITDQHQCSIARSQYIGQPSPLEISYLKSNETRCYNTSDGSINITAMNGSSKSGNYTYQLFNESGFLKSLVNRTVNFTNLPKAYYKIVVSDDNNCKTQSLTFLDNSSKIAIKAFDKANPTCFGQNNGYSSIEALPRHTAPGFFNYLLLLNNEVLAEITAEKATFTGLRNGHYVVTMTDSKGCRRDTSYELSEPGKLQIKDLNVYQPKCYDGYDGLIQARGIGGTSSGIYTFALTYDHISYSKSNTSVMFDDIRKGLYNLSLTDDNSCSIDTSFFVYEPSPVKFDNLISFSPSCPGSSDAEINARATGGTTPDNLYTYAIRQNGYLINKTMAYIAKLGNLAAGTYTLEVSDKNKCATNQVFTIKDPEPVEFKKVDYTNPLCFNDANAKIIATGKGGTVYNNKYLFNLYKNDSFFASSKENTVEFKALLSGNYQIEISDDKNCSTREILKIINPDKLDFKEVTNVPIKCFGDKTGEIGVWAKGGTSYTGNYSYLLSNQIRTIDSGFVAKAKYQNLEKGFYQLTVKDDNKCRITDGVFLEEPYKMRFSAADYNLMHCNDPYTSVFTKVVGGTAFENGYLYKLIQNQSYIEEQRNLSVYFNEINPGNYSIIASDSNGCSLDTSFNIDAPKTISMNRFVSVSPKCYEMHDGSISLSAKGSENEGFYKFSILGEDHNLSVIFGESADYREMFGGTYQIIIEDDFGCLVDTSVILFEPPLLELEVNTEDISCKGNAVGSATAKTSGGTPPYDYQWFESGYHLAGNVDHVDNLKAGQYEAMTRDANGCPHLQTGDPWIGLGKLFSISEPQKQLSLEVAVKKNPGGFGRNDGSVTLQGLGGKGNYLYSANDKDYQISPYFDNLAAGMHKFYVRDNGNCTSNILVEIRQPDPIILTQETLQHINCKGNDKGLARYSATGGVKPYRFSIDDGLTYNESGLFENLKSGKYKLIVIDINGNTITDSFVITEPANKLEAGIKYTLDAKCKENNGIIQLKTGGGTGSLSFNWNGINQNVDYLTNLKPGDYYITITDAKGCKVELSAFISTIDGPVIQKFDKNDITCNGLSNGSIHIYISSGKPPYSIKWANPLNESAEFVQNLKPAVYKVEISDNDNCLAIKDFVIKEPLPLSIAFDQIINPKCFNYHDGFINSIVTGGTRPYYPEWRNDKNQVISRQLVSQNLSKGTYMLSVKDKNDCLTEKSAILTEPDEIKIEMDSVYVLCKNTVKELDAKLQGYTYKWTSSKRKTGNQQKFTVDAEGTYTVTATDSKACYGKKVFTVKTTDDLIKTNFLMQSSAYVGDSIVFVDITLPVPTKTNWKFPNEFSLVKNDLTSPVIRPLFAGKYMVGLKTAFGGCTDYLEKEIIIYQKDPDNEKNMTKGDYLLGMKLYPNPNSGAFILEVKLSQVSEIILELLDSYGSKPINIKKVKGSDEYLVQYDVSSLPPGMYMVKVIVGNAFKTMKFTKY